ncbi:hypothetical protein ACFE04_010717 [Oxalis oulophora]
MKMQGVIICRVLLVLAFFALITKEAFAGGKHEVGGSQGWDESADFNSWSSDQTLKVGDQIVFKYDSGLHSVVELGSESAYKNCDLSNALNTFNSGNDVVKLNKPGTRYFTCGTLGHCDQGMKVEVKTVTGNAPSTPSSTTTSSSSSRTITTSFNSCLSLLLVVVVGLMYMV